MKIQRVSSMFVMSLHCLCLCNYMFVVSSLCLDNQRSLLLQLKNNLTFFRPFTWAQPSAGKLKSWNTSDDCCKWMGVTCDHEGHVTGLDLIEELIAGGIGNSSSLFHLQHLQNLNLAHNFIQSEIPSGFNKLENLSYLNMSRAGFEGQVSVEISQLTKLVTLDLSYSFLKLENPNLRQLVQNLTSLRQLYLDDVTITAPGKEWCNALLSLPDLQELSMSGCNLSGPLDSSLTRLENLSVIILDDNNFTSSLVPETFANFKNLTILRLADCRLTGTFPQKIFQIATLSVIDVSHNYDLRGSFPDFSMVAPLQTLKVSYTSFNGALPNSLSNLTTLTYLGLSWNNFTGPLPSFGMAKKLTHLDLSYNSLSGQIPSSHFEGLNNLVNIDLSYNSINGIIPSSLFTLPLLQEIRLSDNQFSQLDEFINVTASTLDTLDLSKNNLSGPFPVFLFQLSALSYLSLYSNRFNGSVQLNKLLQHKNLTVLDLSYNNLIVNLDVTNSDPTSYSKLWVLGLASCQLTAFPDSLRNQSSLEFLDLSDNHIQGSVPNWIWKLQNLEKLNISHNLLTDFEEPLENLTNLHTLDVHNNQLQGPIPILEFGRQTSHPVRYFDYSRNKFSSVIPRDFSNCLSFTFFLSLANNNFHGSIPDSLCDASELQVLDLSNNNFSGTIPPCLLKMNYEPEFGLGLGVLNLQNNNLRGHIPDMFPASCMIRTLNLHGNLLEGPIPKSLANCSTVEVLDLGTNQLIDGFPCFLKNISTLRVLVLRNNKLQGSLGCSKANNTWPMLQIVDVAFNNFCGELPGKYFMNWKSMMHDDNQPMSKFQHIGYEMENGLYYEDSLTVVNKGQEMELVKILTIFTCIDFSSNHFEGPIPEELMDFTALYVFNLSNNAFSGEIPSSIGNLKHLESLDLSMNNLHGEIPVQLASLTFLSYLNLSFNHLEGKIPTGTQLQSFQASSFEGNDGLYGPPLTEESKAKNQGLQPQEQPSRGKLTCKTDWNFLSAELGLVSGLAAVFFPLLFWKSWRVQYWEFVDKVLCWIFPQLYREYVTRRGQTYTVLRWQH